MGVLERLSRSLIFCFGMSTKQHYGRPESAFLLSPAQPTQTLQLTPMHTVYALTEAAMMKLMQDFICTAHLLRHAFGHRSICLYLQQAGASLSVLTQMLILKEHRYSNLLFKQGHTFHLLD